MGEYAIFETRSEKKVRNPFYFCLDIWNFIKYKEGPLSNILPTEKKKKKNLWNIFEIKTGAKRKFSTDWNFRWYFKQKVLSNQK